MQKKVAVITGAGGGIGRATAIKLSENNIICVLLGGNNQDKLNETYQLVLQKSDALMLPGDLTDPEFIRCGIKQAIDKFGQMDILINNAGIAQNSAFEDITLEEFDRIMAINVRVPFMLTQAALPFLKKSSCATIINIASIVSHFGYAQQSAYSASKHALLGLTKSIAREYYKDNIRVHAIAPGGVYTDMVKVSRPDLTSDGMIMPEDIAQIVWFFLANRGNAVIDEIVVHRLNKEPFMM